MSVKSIKDAVSKKKDIIVQKETEFCGEKVILKRISGYYMAEWREWSNSDKPEIKRLERAKLLQLCIHDPESGNRVYDDIEVTQIIGLGSIDIDEIYFECLRVNGYGEQGRDDILKNLVMTLGEDGLRELHEIIGARLQSFSKDIPTTSSKSNGS